MFAGCSVVSDLLFTPVDIGKVEVSCYDYIWWIFLFYILLSEISAGLQAIGDGHRGVGSRRQSKWI